ncbi:MAG: TetR/AcrR family transcriptional regulator [Gemmatimonadota bacterium]|nr:TetR/AcrR family transcriptional regulator [Gemmatimonadota bacterium]MDH3367779.1 TetR/AcrR family transcriptional regulator [Gemmatimonadota bacterium]MDH3479358.1 TetR/AcrR family transcriptional regulator [Gemmatimonadota bacterium]MDH3570452.1 TetR/AcrR family transcriptional regulator [Gemmatimonadota bacterium]MDH5551195.1 TetR/AcrR family transcriptional regulator [Gemmatimonadota bacterium]
MTQQTGTARSLLDAARELFIALGYDGTSIRAITSRAQANLGAVTYHFGSKSALYEAVAESVMTPLRDHLVGIAGSGQPPLDRVEALLRGFFEYLRVHPEPARLMVQQLASGRPAPDAVSRIIRTNHDTLTQVLAEGQTDGTIREGNPRFLALSIIAQPVWLTLVRHLLQQTIGIDQDERHTRQDLVETTVRFVRAGLSAQLEARR